jgi:hypothetical protein
MDARTNRKLDELRVRLEGVLAEAHPASYAERILDADVKFWEQTAKNLKSALGKKLSKIEVHRGVGTVWLEVEGEDSSDLSVELTLALHTKSWTDVDVMLDGKHAMKGKLSKTTAFKTGELTPAEAAAMALEHFR